jgi:hypothetical protein
VSQDADDLLVLLVEAEARAAPARVRFSVFRTMGGTTIQINDVEVAASVADQDIEDLADDGYVRLREPFLDLTAEGRERGRLLVAARELTAASHEPEPGEPRSSDETWTWRELPFLREALPRVDAGEQPGLTEIAEAIGITQQEARAAATELEHSSYISMRWMPHGAGGGPPPHGQVVGVHERARRALGSWPSAEGIVDQLVAALLAAADQAESPEEADELRDAAADLGTSVVKGVAVSVITKLITGLWT